jgi:hypothetical protein
VIEFTLWSIGELTEWCYLSKRNTYKISFLTVAIFFSVNAENINTVWFKPPYIYVIYLYKVSHQTYFPTNSLLNTKHLTNTKAPPYFGTQVPFSGCYYNRVVTASLLVTMLQPPQLPYYELREFGTYGDPLFTTNSNFSVYLTKSSEK